MIPIIWTARNERRRRPTAGRQASVFVVSRRARRCSDRATRPWRSFVSRAAGSACCATLKTASSVVMHVARPGETFAEAALFADAYHCDAIAQDPSRVTVIPKHDLLRNVRRDASEVLELARALAGQVRDLRARLEIRNIRAADQRLLAWLRLRARGNPPSLELDRRWTQVADEIGLTREATYRALSMMRRDGRIRIDGRQVCLARGATGHDSPSPGHAG